MEESWEPSSAQEIGKSLDTKYPEEEFATIAQSQDFGSSKSDRQIQAVS